VRSQGGSYTLAGYRGGEDMKTTTAVLHTGGMYRGSEKSVVEQALSRLLAVASVEANPVAQTATVTYDPTGTSLAALQEAVERCGMHCPGAGRFLVPLRSPRRARASCPGTRPHSC